MGCCDGVRSVLVDVGRKIERIFLFFFFFVGFTLSGSVKIEANCFVFPFLNLTASLTVNRQRKHIGLHFLVDFIWNDIDLVEDSFEVNLFMVASVRR